MEQFYDGINGVRDGINPCRVGALGVWKAGFVEKNDSQPTETRQTTTRIFVVLYSFYFNFLYLFFY